jgi:hypothetical protein
MDIEPDWEAFLEPHWEAFYRARAQTGVALRLLQEATRRCPQGLSMDTFRERVKELYIDMHTFAEMEWQVREERGPDEC